MNTFDLPYHRSKLSFELPPNITPDIYSPIKIPATSNPAQSVMEHLRHFQNMSGINFGNVLNVP
jgi:hypothetical protein